jgi:hypothetical protein
VRASARGESLSTGADILDLRLRRSAATGP